MTKQTKKKTIFERLEMRKTRMKPKLEIEPKTKTETKAEAKAETKAETNIGIPGYFTVEAAMIFPYVIGTILLVIYIWFFLYNRCLQELDASLVAVRGSTQQGLNLSERCDYTTDLWNKLYKDEYFSWEWTEENVDIEKNILNVQVGGQLEFSFPGFNFWGGEDIWKSETNQYGKIIKRALLLRTARQIGKR